MRRRTLSRLSQLRRAVAAQLCHSFWLGGAQCQPGAPPSPVGDLLAARHPPVVVGRSDSEPGCNDTEIPGGSGRLYRRGVQWRSRAGNYSALSTGSSQSAERCRPQRCKQTISYAALINGRVNWPARRENYRLVREPAIRDCTRR